MEHELFASLLSSPLTSSLKRPIISIWLNSYSRLITYPGEHWSHSNFPFWKIYNCLYFSICLLLCHNPKLRTSCENASGHLQMSSSKPSAQSDLAGAQQSTDRGEDRTAGAIQAPCGLDRTLRAPGRLPQRREGFSAKTSARCWVHCCLACGHSPRATTEGTAEACQPMSMAEAAGEIHTHTL